MQESISSHIILNEIRMLRSVFTGTFLIVEGDLDKRVYQIFLELRDCQIKPITYRSDSNKEEVIEIIKILNADANFTGAVAIVDADFAHLEEVEESVENLFLTDFHDLECLIFVSPALERVLGEFGSEEKIKEFGRDIREYIFEIGSVIGYLRWISLSDGLNLKFESLDFGKFINKDNLTFDLDSFITTVKNNSHTAWAEKQLQKPNIDNSQTANKINNLVSKNHDKKQVACGKDLVEIFSLGLQKVWGTKSKENPIDSDRIGQGLRLAYEFEFFVSTNLYQSVKMWENENTPFKVFR